MTGAEVLAAMTALRHIATALAGMVSVAEDITPEELDVIKAEHAASRRRIEDAIARAKQRAAEGGGG